MKKKTAALLAAFIAISFAVTGCSNTAGGSSGNGASGTTVATASSEGTTSTTGSDADTAATILTSSQIAVDTEFTANDLEVGYDESTATAINLNGSSIHVSGNGATADGSTVTISEEGTYVVNGTLEDGQIIVDAGDNDKVRLVLNGVTISCSDHAPIYVKNADKVFITLEDNTVNTLTDGSEYVQTDENSVDGVIFSKADLTFNGGGTLNITANYKHGIVSKDELVFTGGTYNITAAKDAINGKDCVKIKDGVFILSSTEGNGIQSKNDEDTTAGYVYIYGGSITVTACREGIEGTAIIIEGGNVDVTAADDGFNAASAGTSTSSSASATTDIARGGKGNGGFGGGDFGGGGAFENDTNCYITISGGTISINASGDGIDSNGSIYISGGTIVVSGPTEDMNGGMDYNGTADISGGTIVVAGSAGMAQGFSETSTQYSLLDNLTSACAGGSKISLADTEGNVIISFTPDKQYQSVVISTPDLENGATYTLTCGDQTADITLSSVVTSVGQAGMMGGGMRGGRGGNMPDQGRMIKPGN